jgi:hypothetical protein
VDLNTVRGLYSGTEVSFTDRPVMSYTFPIADGTGKPLVAPGTVTMDGKGVLSFTLRVPSLAYR